MVATHQDKEVMTAALLHKQIHDFQQHISYQEDL